MCAKRFCIINVNHNDIDYKNILPNNEQRNTVSTNEHGVILSADNFPNFPCPDPSGLNMEHSRDYTHPTYCSLTILISTQHWC